jgi:hypothetical protein
MATGLTVLTYNTGQWPHTLFLRAEVLPRLGEPPGAAAGGLLPRAARPAATSGIARLARTGGGSSSP